MGAAPYLRNNAYQISDMYPTSSLHVHRYKNNGKAHLSTSKLRTKGCSSRKMKEVLFYSSLGTKPTPTELRTLVQKQVLGIGEEYLAHCSDSFTNSCTSDMQLGSMWTTSSFFSPTQQRQCSLLLRFSSPDSFEHLYHGKNWNLAALFNGMDGPSDHHS